MLIVLCECVRTFAIGGASFKTYLIGCVIRRLSTLERDSELRRPKAGVIVPLESGLQVADNMVKNDSQRLDEYGIIDEFDREWLEMRMKQYSWREIALELDVPRNTLVRAQRRLRKNFENSRGE